MTRTNNAIAALVMWICVFAGAAYCGTVSVSVAGRSAPTEPEAYEQNGHLFLPSSFLTDRLGLRISPASEPGSWLVDAYGRYLRVTHSSPVYVVDSTRMQAPVAAQLRGGRLYVPAEMISRAFGYVWGRSRTGAGYELTTPGAVVEEVRAGSQEGYLRLVFDISRPAPFWSSRQGRDWVLDIPAPSPTPTTAQCLRLLTFDDPMGVSVRMGPGSGNWTRLTVSYREGGEPQVMTLGDPTRIVADIPRLRPLTPPTSPPATPKPAPKPVPAAPKAVATPWQVRNFNTSRGDVRVFALTASPTAIRLAMAGSTILSKARVSRIAAREGAPAAVNGGHFDACGAPLGLLVIDGEWIKQPMRTRCALGLTYTGEAIMGRQRFEGAVRIEGLQKINLGGLNTSHWGKGNSMVYTRRWGSGVAGSAGRVRVAIASDGRVSQVETQGRDIRIPEGGYVISSEGSAGTLMSSVTPGRKAQVILGAVPEWPKLRYAIGAGPQLVRDGQREVTHDEELFRLGISRACPRTAVGIKADGNVVVAAAEAHRAGGLTLWELASVMWKLGCKNAMALDGGGSTTVYWRGKVANHPTDGSERSVSNALLVFGIPDAG